MNCRFVPCDREAILTVTVEGETPVELCQDHGNDYARWLKNREIVSFEVKPL